MLISTYSHREYKESLYQLMEARRVRPLNPLNERYSIHDLPLSAAAWTTYLRNRNRPHFHHVDTIHVDTIHVDTISHYCDVDEIVRNFEDPTSKMIFA